MRLPTRSFLPLSAAGGVFSFLGGAWCALRWGRMEPLALVLPLSVAACWGRTLLIEGSVTCLWTRRNERALATGFLLFLGSEAMLFFAFFVSLFVLALAPSGAMGGTWPPYGAAPLDAWAVPLFNTAVLLSSGVAATAGHRAALARRRGARRPLTWAGALGILFLACQGWEYRRAEFDYRGGAHGCLFFLATGCHGLHVGLGTACLFLQAFRGVIRDWPRWVGRPLGVEAAVWYWHFVDAVWLLLWAVFYVWAVFR